MQSTRIAAMLRGLVGLAVLLAFLGGCGGQQAMLNAKDLDNGLIIVLPGIDGRAWHNEAACKVLSDADLGMAVELYDWTSPLGPLFNQTAMENNRQKAAMLAEHIDSYLREHQGRPVVLVGHSGGTAIAAWAAEQLKSGEEVAGIIMLASSLSPHYDLSMALAHCRLGITSLYSDRDEALLGAGTTLLGTMDGQHTPSAGKVRFQKPQGNCGEAYGKLLQVPWEPQMAETGHDGGHFGYTAPRFIAAYVAPLVVSMSGTGETLAVSTSTAHKEIAAAIEAGGAR